MPRVNSLIFMASSTNPHEHIHRRKRVLRKHSDKTSAQIHDILTFRASVDAPTAYGEIDRALHLAKNSRNLAPTFGLQAYSDVSKTKEQIPDEVEQDNEDA